MPARRSPLRSGEACAITAARPSKTKRCRPIVAAYMTRAPTRSPGQSAAGLSATESPPSPETEDAGPRHHCGDRDNGRVHGKLHAQLHLRWHRPSPGAGKESTMTISPNDIMKANGVPARTVTAAEEQRGGRLARPDPSMRTADAAVSLAASAFYDTVDGYSDATSSG